MKAIVLRLNKSAQLTVDTQNKWNVYKIHIGDKIIAISFSARGAWYGAFHFLKLNIKLWD